MIDSQNYRSSLHYVTHSVCQVLSKLPKYICNTHANQTLQNPPSKPLSLTKNQPRQSDQSNPPKETIKQTLSIKPDQVKKIPQSGICPAPCVLHQCTSPLPQLQYICKTLRKSSLHEYVVFSVCAYMRSSVYSVYHIYHVEFHFGFGHQITFPV